MTKGRKAAADHSRPASGGTPAAARHPVSICQECFPSLCPHPLPLPHTRSRQLAGGNGCARPASRQVWRRSYIPLGRAESSGPGPNLCALALSQHTGTKRWAGSGQGRKRRRRMAARQPNSKIRRRRHAPLPTMARAETQRGKGEACAHPSSLRPPPMELRPTHCVGRSS